MANKYLTTDKCKLLKTKLDRLTINLQDSVNSSNFQTKESIVFEAIKALNTFYKSLNEPQFEIKELMPDTLPEVDLYNELWQQILDDLIIVFSELENTETLTLVNFNFITTEINRITSRMKSVSSKLGDYILYASNPTKDAFYFKDSFNDISKIDYGTSLLNEDQCDINQTEGIITLPINYDKDSNIYIKETPIINSNSNGVIGNNQEIDKDYHGSVTDILDRNPDSWFEYERIVDKNSDDKQTLILDFTVNIGTPSIINHIRINPNNFGTKTVVKIINIDTSVDGKTFTSIKDDIPIMGYSTEDEENIFTLAPSTSKYSGQGFYTFTPRKVKYIRFTLSQSEAYVINTIQGEKLRYAIGIRDIEIKAFSFKSKGELISTAYSIIEEIRKVILQSNQNPTDTSELVSVDHYISPDNGITWYQIQPKEMVSTSGRLDLPEILDFNGVSNNSIKTSSPVYDIRYKVTMERNDDAFNSETSSLAKTIKTKAELHVVPNTSPFTLTLLESPITDSVVIVDPLFGSRGIERFPYILGHTNEKFDLRKYRFPFTNLPWPVKKVFLEPQPGSGKYHLELMTASEWINVEVGGEVWTQTTSGLQFHDATYKHYDFNPNTGIIQFGNDTTGKAPGSDEPICFWFKPERLFPSEIPNNHIAKLDFSTSNNKDNMTIKRYDEVEDATILVPKKATVIRLGYKDITDLGNITTVLTGTQRTFLNGKDELLTDNDWSIDMDEGIIYLYTPTSDSIQSSISFKYQPIYTLTIDDWDWADTNILKDSVSVKDSAWKTITVVEESVTMEPGITMLDVAQLSTIKGTYVFNVVSGFDALDDDVNPFRKEVPFIDGITELSTTKIQTTEQIPNLDPGLNSVSFEETITTDTNYIVYFSNTDLFSTEVVGEPANPGEYRVRRTEGDTGEYEVMTSAASTSPGTVTYFYDNSTYKTNGLYSINYKHGQIHTQLPMNLAWTCKITYDYVDYRAEYRIARLLNPKSYETDITNKTITINDNEILFHATIPRATLNTNSPYYLVNYDYIDEAREDIASLKDYFTPVLKDYIIKVLTKGRIY